MRKVETRYVIREHATKRKTVEVIPVRENWSSDDDDHFQRMSEWCDENECGRRTSYNMFTFRTLKEMTMFAMKWS